MSLTWRAITATRPESSASRSISASVSPASRPASRSRALASRISGVRSSRAAAMASSAPSFTPRGSAASCVAARLAAAQISATDVAVTATLTYRLREHEVVAMDRFFAGPWQPRPNIGRFQPAHAPELGRGVVADPLADQVAVERDLDRVARVEVAGHLNDPDRQEARPALAERA